MGKLQDIHMVEAPANVAQINESEGEAWHAPTLTTWEAPEETQVTISGPSTIV
jgi:hypothetical protein